MLVEEVGVDVMGKVANVIPPHWCCTGYEADESKTRIQDLGKVLLSIKPANLSMY